MRSNLFTTAGQQLPVVVADGTGSFVVAWQSPQDGSYTGIFGRQMTVPLFFGDFELGDVCAWSTAVGGGSCPL